MSLWVLFRLTVRTVARTGREVVARLGAFGRAVPAREPRGIGGGVGARRSEWPRGLLGEPKEPTPEFMSYECSRRIAYSKRRRSAA